MDGNHNHRSGLGAKRMVANERGTIPKLIYNIGWVPRCWKDPNYNVWSRLPRAIARVSYCPYVDEDGEPCRCIVGREAQFHRSPNQSELHLQLDDSDGGRVVRVHARYGRRVGRWLDNLLRRNGAL